MNSPLSPLPNRLQVAVAAAAAVGLCAVTAMAQQDQTAQEPQQPGAAQTPYDPSSLLQPPSLTEQQGQEPLDPEGLNSTWVRPDAFQGFPSFPPNLGGYGRYPQPGGLLAPPTNVGPLPPPAPPAAPDWPAWIKQKRPVDLPYEAGVAVLVRQADRVWLRQAGDDAFVPLYHFDTARGLGKGADVQVRQTGEFLLLLHGGTRFASYGTADLHLVELGERQAHVAFASLTRIELTVHGRGITCDLPDGSVLQIDPVPDDPAAIAAAGTAQLVLERAIEPGRYAGRATVFNPGDRPVLWHTPFGDHLLHPGHRATFLLTPPTAALSRELHEDAVTAAAFGARRRWTAAASGSVTWSGARFELAPGATLELDPMLGDPFAPAPPPESAPNRPGNDPPE